MQKPSLATEPPQSVSSNERLSNSFGGNFSSDGLSSKWMLENGWTQEKLDFMLSNTT